MAGDNLFQRKHFRLPISHIWNTPGFETQFFLALSQTTSRQSGYLRRAHMVPEVFVLVDASI
jgi:hypothetical protein